MDLVWVASHLPGKLGENKYQADRKNSTNFFFCRVFFFLRYKLARLAVTSSKPLHFSVAGLFLSAFYCILIRALGTRSTLRCMRQYCL